MNVNITKALIGGILGTGVMTAFGVYAAPLMGMPAMNPANMLAGQMGGVLALGWAAHFMIGIILAFGYAATASWLPGPPIVRGALYGIAPWLLAQLAVMPMMGMPVFSGSMMMAGGSLVGHLLYGATVGAVYGEAYDTVGYGATVPA